MALLLHCAPLTLLASTQPENALTSPIHRHSRVHRYWSVWKASGELHTGDLHHQLLSFHKLSS